MSDPKKEVSSGPKTRTRSWKWTKFLIKTVLIVAVVLVLACGAMIVRLKSGPMAFPIAQDTVTRLAKQAFPNFDVHVGEVSLATAKKGFRTQILLSDFRILTKTGQTLAQFPVLRASVDPVQSFKTQSIDLTTVQIEGAEIRVLRDTKGKYNFLPNSDENTETISPEALFEIVNKAADKSPMRNLKLIEMLDTKIIYVDRIRNQYWTSLKARIISEREGDQITANTDILMQSDGHDQTSVGIRFGYLVGADHFDFGFKFDQASTADLADQVSALDWLRILDTKVSGSLNSTFSTDGSLDSLSGFLESKLGQLKDSPEIGLIKFNDVKAYFDYDKLNDQLAFTDITADSNIGSFAGDAAISFQRDDQNFVTAIAGNSNINRLDLHPTGLFENPLSFSGGSLNLHATLSPFTIAIENAVLKSEHQTMTIYGSSVAGDKYWNNFYIAQFNQVTKDELLSYWPVNTKPKTRNWIKDNIIQANASNGIAQLQTRNGKTKVNLSFDIDDAEVRYLKSFPHLMQAKGRGTLTEKNFRINLSSGYVITDNNQKVTLGGSEFYIPDMRVKPAIGDISLKIKGGVDASLSLLDEKPFEFLSKVGLRPNIALGHADISAKLTVPLTKKTKPDQVIFQADAIVKDIRSETLAKGHVISADEMSLTADNTAIKLIGNAKFDGIPAKTNWTMKLGKEHGGQSTISAAVTLNDRNLKSLGVIFDKGMITGSAPADLKIVLKPKTAPTYNLKSNTQGMGINIAGLNWQKPQKAKAPLTISGQLGDVFTLDSLTLDAPNLLAKGAVRFNQDNSFKRADFSTLKVGRWLDVVAAIENFGQNSKKITVSKGSVDLRKADFSGNSKSSGYPMDVVLDQLILTDNIKLTNFRSKLRTHKGLRGPFTAKVNGQADISGSVFPQKYGTAAEITTTNTGGLLRASGLFNTLHDGILRLVFIPDKQEGQYHGTFQIKKARIKQDSVLADLLNAVSVVGLVQQLMGDGIVFETIDGQFVLKPQGVELRETSATGVSIGMTVDGNYNSSTKQVNFEGAITPVYAINGTLQRVFGKALGRRKGEGLFSFVYRVSGASSDPKISVNPLSILAPGVTREIFRKDIPNIDEKVQKPKKEKPKFQEVDR